MFGKHSLGMEEKKCYVERHYFRKKIKKLWWKNYLTREKEAKKNRKTPEKKGNFTPHYTKNDKNNRDNLK